MIMFLSELSYSMQELIMERINHQDRYMWALIHSQQELVDLLKCHIHCHHPCIRTTWFTWI